LGGDAAPWKIAILSAEEILSSNQTLRPPSHLCHNADPAGEGPEAKQNKDLKSSGVQSVVERAGFKVFF